MAKRKATDDEFVAAWSQLGSVVKVGQALGLAVRSVYTRRRDIEARRGIILEIFSPQQQQLSHHQGKVDLTIENGTCIVFSDAHFWPDYHTTTNRALITFSEKIKPNAIICNGDAFDGATISRFPRPFFDEHKPTVANEIKICEERLTEIENSAKNAQLVWCLGNHDLRFEAKLAAQAPEYQGVKGFHLKDWFPRWKPAWSCFINKDVEIRHRYKGGIHATHNNVLWNQHSTFTGHLHSMKVAPFTDGRGKVKYGVDTGTLADIDGPQFADYMEGRIPNWRSGFVLLTFRNSQLLMPELIQKFDANHVEFRGQILNVDTWEAI